MTEQEQRERAEVGAQAKSWLRTPYRHRAAVRGSGVDCARILIEVYADAGMIERFDPGSYARDWHLHRGEERYLNTIERYARLVRPESTLSEWLEEGHTPPMGDILVWRIGRTFSHSAIVTDWPLAIHASFPSRMVEEVHVLNTPVHKMSLRTRQYSVWGESV